MTEMPPNLAAPGLDAVFAQQRKAARSQPYPSYAQRCRDLRALRTALSAYQDELAAAMSADFGRRSEFECKMLDVMGPALQIDHALAHLRRWMAPQRRAVDWLFLGNGACVLYQPKGMVGVIAAWNFPVIESVGPLVTALAAGNRVMIKMSEYSPRCTEVLRKLLGEIYPLDQVAVLGGDVESGRAFSALAFDHIVFTGSPEVGRQIMRAASANLTPVTLELGGKSPAIVARSADIAAAGASIAHGKAFNSGQACVAPDYALVDPAQIDAFVRAAKAAFSQMYPDPASDPQYTMMASDRHADRVRSLLDDAQAKGGTIHACVGGDGSRVIPLHIVTGATSAMRIMQEELFNPILPVVACASIDAAIAYVQERPRPLALYYYGSNRAEMARLERETHAGGMTYNDWAWHVFQCDLPFGGSGNSGIGSWRGPEGFRSLSHAKAVFNKRRWFPTSLFRPPYDTWLQRVTMRIFLG
jgi:coniferyl-aldehyde dehydrogenase